MVSITMMPCDVVSAHADQSVMPTKYRLSNTFAGSTCHCEAGGGPACRPPPPAPRPAGAAVGAGAGNADSQTRSCSAVNWMPAAAFAAARWLSTVPVTCWAPAVAVATAITAAIRNVFVMDVLTPGPLRVAPARGGTHRRVRLAWIRRAAGRLAGSASRGSGARRDPAYVRGAGSASREDPSRRGPAGPLVRAGAGSD